MASFIIHERYGQRHPQWLLLHHLLIAVTTLQAYRVQWGEMGEGGETDWKEK